MSNSVYPILQGESYPILIEPNFSTIIQESASGNEFRLASFTFPRKRFTLTYNYLSDSNGQSSAQYDAATLQGFYTARYGKWDSFLYNCQTDNVAQSSIIGTGDGTTTAFQLYRSYGAGSEPVFDVNTTGINSMTFTGGSGYKTAPQVVIAAPTGANPIQATAIAAISGGGAVNAIFIRNSGNGYSSAPAISFVGGGGSGATATAIMAPVLYLNGVSTAAFTRNATGMITFTSAPGSTVQITTDVAYYWRCRFDEDSLELSNNYNGFFSCKKAVLYQTRS